MQEYIPKKLKKSSRAGFRHFQLPAITTHQACRIVALPFPSGLPRPPLKNKERDGEQLSEHLPIQPRDNSNERNLLLQKTQPSSKTQGWLSKKSGQQRKLRRVTGDFEPDLLDGQKDDDLAIEKTGLASDVSNHPNHA
ncbi:hypothetical protein TWF225_000166 [Orbilia oligospora]|nr:hypothetical protein TWF225_000166 [Orbilia oligospora]KAF3235120.1 hypothetical protein TWF128_002115 [Orbilia oligospora]KAF3259941.1 hypothetical protein TWF217_004972 [Orbilia oligospora]KAF3297533.1 hypothetical protein TWF132_005957 [Orbilia oligospora]